MEDTIVLYPSPGIGHIVSMVELGKLFLVHYGHLFSIKILLISSKFWESPTVTNYINAISETYPSISFHRLPPRSVVDSDHPPRSRHAKVFELIQLNVPDALQALQEISETCHIRALIIDMFCTCTLSGAKDLGVPTYYFFTSGAACLAAFLYFPTVCKQYTKPFKDLTSTLLHFPHLPSLKATHVPEPMLDMHDPAYDGFLSLCSGLSKADGVIVNTFDDLEPDAIRTLADGAYVPDAPTPPVYCIGPLLAGGDRGARHPCLSWLDRQPSKSVVYLCFGSRGSLSSKQVKEIANGLEKSGKRFLWVVKSPPLDEKHNKQVYKIVDFDLEQILPEGFLKRIEDRGMVVKSWAPQQEVLKHDAIGGFVTHCGWNSVLEAAIYGVPLAAWPLYAEQHLNRNVLVEYMNMAIPIDQRDEEDGFVSGDEFERRVRELMDSVKRKELREKSRKLKESASAAWGESGSSTLALATFVETLKRG